MNENLPNVSCRFWKHQWVLLEIFYLSSLPSKVTRLYSLSSGITYFGQKELIKVHMSEIFECSGQNSINLSCQFWTDKSIPLHIFASLFVVMPHNSPVSFEVIKFPLLVKGSHESPNFETLECSGSNLPDSSCHFWKQESLFLQILYQSSVLSHIPSLYFFGSNIIYFGQK